MVKVADWITDDGVAYINEVTLRQARLVSTDMGDSGHWSLFHGRIRTAYLYRCVWSGIAGR